MFGVYIPSIENSDLLNKTLTGYYKTFSHGGLDIIGNNASRITFRFFDAKEDSYEQLPPYISFYYYYRKNEVFDPKYGPSSGEFTSTIAEYMSSFEKPDWRYNAPGNGKTSNSAGGYTIYLNKGNETVHNKLLKEWFFSNNSFNALLGLITFDTIFYSSHYNYFAYYKQEFLELPSGNVIPKSIINVFYKFIKLYKIYYL